MWTVATQTPTSRPIVSNEDLLIAYPEADVILRSHDSYEFPVLKPFIVHNSPILEEKLLTSLNTHPERTASKTPAESDVYSERETNASRIPGVQLPIDGAILFSLLTYIFPVPPVLPSTVEQVMELLSVAQMYKMDVVLTHIRNHIAQQEPPFIREETAFLVYALSQKHGLRLEALRAARCTLSFATMTIDHLAKENKLDVMPGAFLYELWKYHQRFRSNLITDLREFKKYSLTMPCISKYGSGLLYWLNDYISKIGAGNAPVSLDRFTFYKSLPGLKTNPCLYCLNTSEESTFWGGLTAVVHNSTVKAESDFAFPIEKTRSEGQPRPTYETSFLRKYSNMPNADVILQSSDLVDFYVQRSVLIVSSPFFKDMFSLPQPPNGAVPDSLPVVHLSEDAETLDSLISMLYPVLPEMPSSSDSALALLAAATKYDMDRVQSSIREEINRRGLLSLTPAESFRMYAVACSKGLIPEMESFARLTLCHPLSFRSLGDALLSFEGQALRYLADFRLRGIREFNSNLKSFFSPGGPSRIWASSSCPKGSNQLPDWLESCSRSIQCIWAGEDSLTNIIPTDEQLCHKYLNALQCHGKNGNNCNSCLLVHALEGDKYRKELKYILEKARNVPFMLEG